eukprot:3079040-Pyramimonas_sp.AAC.1
MHGKCLGFITGKNGPSLSWVPISNKFREGGRRVKLLGQGLTASLIAHNRSALSIASCSGRGYRPGKVVSRVERGCHQLYTCAPLHAFSPWFVGLFRALGLSAQTGDLQTSARAA